jgi:hypothetical protein
MMCLLCDALGTRAAIRSSPHHTKFIVSGNNRTKSMLVGQHVVKKLLVLEAGEYSFQSSNYVGIPVKLLFSGWFFMLKVAMEVKRIIYPHLSF